MIKVSDVVGSRSESVSLVTDYFGFIVEPLHCAIINRRVEVVEKVILSAPEHPGKVAYWLQP